MPPNEKTPEKLVARRLPAAGAYALDVQNSSRLWRNLHETYCVTLVTAGRGRWRYRGREAEVLPNRLALMEPGELHVTTCVHEPSDFCAIFLPAELVAAIVESTIPGVPHFSAMDTTRPDLVEGFHTFWTMFTAGYDVEGQEQQLSLAVARLFEPQQKPHGFRSPTARLKKAASLLRDAYESAPWERVDIRCVAADLGMSYHWLVHSFTDQFGMPPYQYVQMLRLVKVRAMLARGPHKGVVSLTDVAAVSGFSDKSHLHRTVKRDCGLSPWQLAIGLNSEWERAWRRREP